MPAVGARAGTAQQAEAQLKQLEQAHTDSLVTLLKHALENGKAVVVTPLFNSTKEKERPGVKPGDFSRTVQWRKVGDAKSAFAIGSGKGILRVTVGEVHQVDIIEPGSYQLASASFEVHNTKVPDVALKRGLRSRGVGRANYVQTEFQEQRHVQEWRNPTYGTETVKSNQCLVVHVSGHCVSWGVRSEEVTQQTSAGGYRDRLRVSMEPGLQVTASPSKEFASFAVRPGELVLLDAFFARTPNVTIHRDECERTSAQQIACEMSSFQLQRLPSDLEEFKRRTPTITSSPRLGELLSTAQYRPVKVSALKGWSDPLWGQNYYLGAP